MQGEAAFSRSGLITFPAGAASATVPVPGGLGPNSLVLATVQQTKGGAWVRAAIPNTTDGTFVIRLNKTPDTNVRVAWFVVN